MLAILEKNVGNTPEKVKKKYWQHFRKMLTKKYWQHFRKMLIGKISKNIKEKMLQHF
jgi:hypothetical protein